MKTEALNILLNDQLSSEMQLDLLIDFGLDMEDIFDLAMEMGE